MDYVHFFSFSQYDTKNQQWMYKMVLFHQLRWNIWQFKKWLLRTFVECICNCKWCALRGFLNLMATNSNCFVYINTHFYRKSQRTFYSLTTEAVHIFVWQVLLILAWHLQMVVFESKKQTEQRLYQSFGVQGFRLELDVLKSRRTHLHIHRFSFCLAKVFCLSEF